MNKEAFKVVTGVNGRNVFSSAMSLFPKFKEYSLTYEIDEMTTPKIGKIFCFKKDTNIYNNIKYFINESILCGRRDMYILIGMASEVSYPKYCATEWCQINEFWKLKKNHKKLISDGEVVSNSIVPNGTILCQKFIPFHSYTLDSFLASGE